VSFDARERQRELRRAELVLAFRVREQRAGSAFPLRPSARGLELHGTIVAEQPPMKRPEQVVALVGRDRRPILLPLLGKQETRSNLVEPAELELPQQ
jgi:hypothetical protein